MDSEGAAYLEMIVASGPFTVRRGNPWTAVEAEYAKARASMPTAQGVATARPGASLPCPDFEEVTVSVTPYLEILLREHPHGGLWVRCLSCHSWVMPAEGGSRAEVLEHAGEIHECPVAGRRS